MTQSIVSSTSKVIYLICISALTQAAGNKQIKMFVNLAKFYVVKRDNRLLFCRFSYLLRVPFDIKEQYQKSCVVWHTRYVKPLMINGIHTPTNSVIPTADCLCSSASQIPEWADLLKLKVLINLK